MYTTKIRFGFKGKCQLPLFMIWKEWRTNGDVTFARVIFSAWRWFGV